MGIFFSWIIFSFVVGFVGSGRKIGFWGAFFLSLLLSPLIGLIIALVSKNEADEAYKEKVLTVQQNQQETLKKLSETEKTKTVSIVDELEKLKKLREDNLITEDEFQNLKSKIINS
jgi:phosphate/sulfate permease